MEKQISVHRNEIKYFINKRDAAELRSFLYKNMYVDLNADETGSYWIRSLYFDTIDNNDYYDKILGCNIRKKIRLRIYNIAASTVKLEIKNKYSSNISKETLNISREDANKLIKGDSSSLLSYNENTANKVYAYMHHNLYQPKVLIDYQREAFTYPFQNIRITLDKNICASSSMFNLFNKDICMLPMLDSDVFILEIKYDYMLPVFLRRVLSSVSAQKSQISKYCMGRNILRS